MNSKTMRELDTQILENNIIDFRVLKYEAGGTLTIACSSDLSYYHELEITFFDTTYISCPTNFNYARFRIATENEKSILKKTLINEWNELCVAIDIEETADEKPITHYLIAERMSYILERVYYYKRENLKENERIAEWVKD